MFWAGSVVVALAAVVGAGRLWAEGKDQKPAKPAALRTRIGLINLTYVMKNYKKYAKFQEEIKEIVKPFQERDAKLREQAEKLAKEARDSTVVQAKAEDREEKLKKIKHQIEANNDKAKKAVGKKSDTVMQTLYIDVMEAAQRYAAVHDLDLVLHYNDATTKEDYLSAPNIARKLQTGALMPVYTAQGMDITKEVAELLNSAGQKVAP
jgi:Skp family chaperone for outer membrane proteins